MKYMLLIYHDENLWSSYTEPEKQDIYQQYRSLVEELSASGKFIIGDELQPVTTANSVRVRDGKALIVDGPFAETREQLGGFFLVDVQNAEEANAIAARIPSALDGTIEVRPVMAENAEKSAAAD